MSDTDRFDALLMNMAQTQRGIEPLLETVFSFLRRKTDFFSGASPKLVEETVLNAVRKQAALAEKDQYAKKQEEEEKRKLREQKMKRAEEEAKLKKQKTTATATKPTPTKTAEPEPTPRFEEISDDQADAIQSKSEKPAEAEEKKTDEDEEEDSGPPLVGNGGQTDKYVWTQTLQEAQANFAVPNGTKSRQVHVDITATRLKVGLKGGETFVDGPLFKRVKVDDSFWTLEDNNRICIYLQKENQMEWWKTIIQGDVEIDTKKVQPENSKLGDLDADTRQTVEKMMFDQRQKSLGLPTSDDMQKQNILEKFMSQHPEMDFSKAKIN